LPVPLPSSCDGDPAPDRVFPAILPAAFNPPANPKGDLNPLPLAGGSVGEVLAVDEPERGRLALGCGKYPSVRCSDLEDDIIDYSVPATKCLSYLAREMVGNVMYSNVSCCVPRKFVALPVPVSVSACADCRATNNLFVVWNRIRYEDVESRQ